MLVVRTTQDHRVEQRCLSCKNQMTESPCAFLSYTVVVNSIEYTQMTYLGPQPVIYQRSTGGSPVMLKIPRVDWAQFRCNQTTKLLKGMMGSDIQMVLRTALDFVNHSSNGSAQKMNYYSPWEEVHTEQNSIQVETIVEAEKLMETQMHEFESQKWE